MEKNIKNHSRIHIVIFTLISAFLFIFIPISFIDRFLAGIICFGVLTHIKNIKFEFKRWYEIFLLFIICLYLTFAIFGHDLILNNSLRLESFLRFFYFSLGFIWTCYVLQSFLDAIKYLSRIKDRVCTPFLGGYWKKWLILLAIMIPLFALWQIAFNPIVLSPDSWVFLDGWINNRYISSFPPVFTFLVNIICTMAPATPEVMWIGITQNIVFSSLLATILMYFHQRWIMYKYIIPIAIVLPLIPSLGLHTIVVWADLAAGMTLLWLTYVLVRIIDEMILNKSASKKQQLSFYIQLCISLVLTYFIRSNTFIVYMVMIPVLVFLFSLKKEWKLLITITISILFVLLIRFPGFSKLEVYESVSAHEHRYHAAMHDIQTTYYGGGHLSDQTLEALRRYIPTLDDPEVKLNFYQVTLNFGLGGVMRQHYGFDFSELTMPEFLAMYVDTFIRNPYLMTSSMLNRVHAYWVIDPKPFVDAVNHFTIFDRETKSVTSSSAPELGVYRQYNILNGIMKRYMEIMSLHIPTMFFWRFAVYVALMVISIYALIQERRFIWLLTYIPVFIYLATLYLAMGWTDYRYGLPVFFVGLFLPVALLLHKPSTK